jgi:hypothetical protein
MLALTKGRCAPLVARNTSSRTTPPRSWMGRSACGKRVAKAVAKGEFPPAPSVAVWPGAAA